MICNGRNDQPDGDSRIAPGRRRSGGLASGLGPSRSGLSPGRGLAPRRDAGKSRYYRHFYMGLIRDDGTPKLALEHFARHTPRMDALAEFETRVTFCFTRVSEGIAPHHINPPRNPMNFADFCARPIDCHAPAQGRAAVA